MKFMCLGWGSNLWPLDPQSDMLLTALRGPAGKFLGIGKLYKQAIKKGSGSGEPVNCSPSSLCCKFTPNIWARSSEFVSSSIPSWQTLTAHTQPFRGTRDLAFCLKVHFDSLFVWVSSRGSGETARIGYKYQICLTRSIYPTKTFCTAGSFCSLYLHMK